jgi:hypothetical protein
MQLNQFKFKRPGILTSLCLATFLLLSISACKKKEEPPKTNTGNQNPAAEPDYILFKGYKMILRKPRTWEMDINGGDTILYWSGSTGGSGDTALLIRHPESIKAGVNTIVEYAFYYGEVGLFLNWGVPGVSPEVAITGGDYKIERINNRWVSTLKNGTGVWKRTSGDVNYTGIEVKITWPQF